MNRPPSLAQRVGAAYGARWRVRYDDDLLFGLTDRYGNDFAVAAWESWCIEDDQARRVARCGTVVDRRPWTAADSFACLGLNGRPIAPAIIRVAG